MYFLCSMHENSEQFPYMFQVQNKVIKPTTQNITFSILR